MKATLKATRQLQEINGRIAQLERDRSRLTLDVEEQERHLRKHRTRAEELHRQRLEATKTADSFQLKIEQAETEIGKYRGQMSTAKQQHEYDALRHAIASREADIQKWEDEALVALTEADRLAAEEKLSGRAGAQVEAELAHVRGEVGGQTAQYDGRIAELAVERNRLRQQISPEVLHAYDRIAARHPLNALAEVRGRICLGCRTQVTKQIENLLMRGDKIVNCHSCGRMLMLADEESA